MFSRKSFNSSDPVKDASDVTYRSYSHFQGKMTIPGYQFRDYLHRKMLE